MYFIYKNVKNKNMKTYYKGFFLDTVSGQSSGSVKRSEFVRDVSVIKW